MDVASASTGRPSLKLTDLPVSPLTRQTPTRHRPQHPVRLLQPESPIESRVPCPPVHRVSVTRTAVRESPFLPMSRRLTQSHRMLYTSAVAEPPLHLSFQSRPEPPL